MKIDLVGRPKRHDINSDQLIDENFNQAFLDIRKIIDALKAYRVNLASADDVIGAPTTFTLARPAIAGAVATGGAQHAVVVAPRVTVTLVRDDGSYAVVWSGELAAGDTLRLVTGA
jgi:hypothetical protein